MFRRRRRESGGIIWPVLTVIVVAALALPMFVIQRQHDQAVRAMARDGDTLELAHVALARWYERHALAIDQHDTFAIPVTLASQLGLAHRGNWRFAASQRLWHGPISYRRLAVWDEQNPEPRSPFDPASGQFQSQVGNAGRVVDGLLLNGQRVHETEQRLQAVALTLQRWFRVRFERDPLREVTTNHFRPVRGCGAPAIGELPCVENWTPIADQSMARLLGLAPERLVSAWATPIEITHGDGAQTTAPPYSVRLRARTPWGSYLEALAIQPMN
jgi:hypothetical protein